jgi:5'-AMP-activated protein kinase, catalytic alpha subunit
MHTTCGTLNYIAPEIVKNTGYDGQLADIWACGVILYFMLTGRRPFDDESVHKLLDKIIVGDFKFPQPNGGLGLTKQNSTSAADEGIRVKISEEAKDLVKRILNPNPRKRFTIEQIMMHPWMQTADLEISESDEDLENEAEDVDELEDQANNDDWS